MNRRNSTLLLLVATAVTGVIWTAFPRNDNVVVVYVSHDQVFSEPILKDFEKETGIRVRAVYDTEETKSTGAMNRLIAEKSNPQADGYWTGFAARARVLIVHKDENPKPTSVFSYSDPRWRGRTVIANPLFGTTTD